MFSSHSTISSWTAFVVLLVFGAVAALSGALVGDRWQPFGGAGPVIDRERALEFENRVSNLEAEVARLRPDAGVRR